MQGSRLGPFELLGDLGSGGMGKVCRARVVGPAPGLAVGAVVAVKIIHGHLLGTPGFFQRFLREADIGRTVDHDNVVRIHYADSLLRRGVQENFLVMEYVEGHTLRSLLRDLGQVPEELCRHIGGEITKGLCAIHGVGAVHRDLKPENVLITEDHQVKVMDLGMAKLADEVIRLSQTGDFIGSIEYAAPEQFRSSKLKPDVRTDLHALGLLLYELSTGQHPFRDEVVWQVLRNIDEVTPRKVGELNPQLSPVFEEVVHKLLKKRCSERFSSASELSLIFDQGEKSRWWKDRARALRIETKRPPRRIRIPRETRLYGRDADLERLRALYEKAKEGHGQVLLIEGEAGIGKTRLVDEFVSRLRQEGEDLNFLFGSYPPGGAATAAGAFSAAYRDHFGGEALVEALEGYLTATPILVPAFSALLRGETTPTGAEALTKESLQTVFVHATQGLARERTTIVLIDDLHFAPEAGRALFSSLAMAVPGHRILFIGTMRPELSEEWTSNITRLEHAEQRSLPRIGPKDLGKMLRDTFRSERLADELGWRIAEKSDGNPFFAFEVIRGLREGNYIARQPDGSWATTRIIQNIQVPSTVRDLIHARLAALQEQERELLDVASCCGFEFDPMLVGQVLALPEIPLLRRLGNLERPHRLVRSVGRAYHFDHHQIKEALYGGLSVLLRERYHAAIAEALEARLGTVGREPRDLDGKLCVDLCEHYLWGARGEQAVGYLDAALTHLENSFCNEQAIALADRALKVPGLLQGEQRFRVLLRMNARLGLLGHREAQATVLEEARTLAGSQGEQALRGEVERATGLLHLATGRYEEARACHEQHLLLAREVGDRKSEAGALGNLGNVFRRLGRYSEAEAYGQRCLALARQIRDRKAETSATGHLGIVLMDIGRFAEAREHLEQSLVLAKEIGSRQAEATVTGALGQISCSQGLYPEAQVHFERQLTLEQEIGDRAAQAWALQNLGTLFYSLGRSAEAEAFYERALGMSRETGNRLAESQTIGNLGLVSHAQGHYAKALDFLERHVSLARAIGDRAGEANATGNLGSAFLDLGRHAEARVHLEAYLTLSRAINSRDMEGYALSGLTSLAAEQGEGEEAQRFAEQALALRREIGQGGGVADSLIQLGELLYRAGDFDSAGVALEEAVVLLREQGRSTPIAIALALLACLPGGEADGAVVALEEAGESGRTAQVRYLLFEATGEVQHLEEAKRLLDDLIEHAPPDCRALMLENIRLHRDIMAAWKSRQLGSDTLRP